MVACEFPEVVLVRNSANEGFARASNRAASLAIGEFLFFLNNDTALPPRALVRLLHYARAHPDAGMIGPRLLNSDGSYQISYRRRPTVRARRKRASAPATR